MYVRDLAHVQKAMVHNTKINLACHLNSVMCTKLAFSYKRKFSPIPLATGWLCSATK
jgi:hypothetical protein